METGLALQSLRPPSQWTSGSAIARDFGCRASLPGGRERKSLCGSRV